MFCPQCGTKVVSPLNPATSAPSGPSAPPVAEGSSPALESVAKPVDVPSPKTRPAPPRPASPDEKTISRESDRHAACLGSIIVGLAIVILGSDKVHPSILLALPVVIYGGIAFGIWKNSRAAAVAGLIAGIANVIYFVIALGQVNPKQAGEFAVPFLLVCIWVKFLFQSVRGTFAYYRYRSALP